MLPAYRVFAAAGRRLDRQLVDVGAGDERLVSRAGQYHGAHGVVVLQLQNCAAQLVERLRIQGIEDLGPVDGERGDAAVAIEQQVLESHGGQSGKGYISHPAT